MARVAKASFDSHRGDFPTAKSYGVQFLCERPGKSRVLAAKGGTSKHHLQKAQPVKQLLPQLGEAVGTRGFKVSLLKQSVLFQPFP